MPDHIKSKHSQKIDSENYQFFISYSYTFTWNLSCTAKPTICNNDTITLGNMPCFQLSLFYIYESKNKFAQAVQKIQRYYRIESKI